MAIENFIRNVSDQFEENYDVKIQPLLCENFDDAYSKTRKQEEYNEKIRDSELCFFIFFTKAGEYTREEFEVARKKFEETGKPKIYTYFKVIKDEKVEQSLYDFMNELDNTFGHYYGTFDHVDTVKLRILLSLKLQEMDFLEIKAENGNCLVDGKSVMPLDNVSEFMNNKNLEKLRQELKTVEEEYYQLKPIYSKGNCDGEFYSHYSRVASKRQNLIDEIEDLQKLIFNISLRMSHDDVHGTISLRQKEAYRLFELGDYEGCMAVLDTKDIDNDFLRERQRIKDQDIAVCRKYIKEHKTAIDILATMIDYKNRFVEIEKRYSKILPVILEDNLELSILYDYASFCLDTEQYEKGIPYALKSISLQQNDYMYKGIMEHFDYQLLGDLCFFNNNDINALNAYKSSLQCLINNGCEETAFPHDYIQCYYNISKMIFSNHSVIEKEEVVPLLEKIRSIYLSEKDYLPEVYCNYFINSTIELGYIYSLSEDHDKAQVIINSVHISELRQAAEIYKNIYIFLCTRTADRYYDLSNYIEANNYIEKAIKAGEEYGLTQNYYVLYACLQLADIYEHTNKTSDALNVYNSVIQSLNNIQFSEIDEPYANMFLFVYYCLADKYPTINLFDFDERKKQILEAFPKLVEE